MKLVLALLLLMLMLSSLSWAQNVQGVIRQGEQVFSKSCATGYCHGAKGGVGGAPRLAARGFDQPYINNVVTRGLPGTPMQAFGNTLQRGDLTAVVAYVASLNGIANPTVGEGGPAARSAEQVLPPAAARGRELFYDAVRGFGRCSTCHEVNGMGISVAAPMAKVPADVAALRALATPNVSSATLSGDRMPALVLSKGNRSVIFYDLTAPPPVLRTVEPAAVQIAEGGVWKHSSVISAYNDAELASIVTYLRAVVKP